MKGRERFFTIFTLGLLSAVGPFSIDMYLPGFPDIARELNTTVAHITLSITSFFIGISIGQLIYGPLLDKYGRKKPLYVGLVIYILASLGCTYAPSANILIGIRFLQALGACAGMVAARALVRDIFPIHENAKVFSLLMLVIAISPIVAPTLGGYLTALFGWQTIFLVLLGIGVITIAFVYFFLPPGRKPDTGLSLRPDSIIKGFLVVVKVPQFYTYAFSGALSSSGLYAYVAGSPFVIMELYHVSEKEYGWIFATIAMGLIGASQVNTLLLRKYSSEQITRVTLFCQCIAGVMLLVGSSFDLLGLHSTIFLIFIFLSTQGFAFPNTSALSLMPFTVNAGTASALMGMLQLGIGAIATVFVSVLNNKTAVPMTAVMCICAIASFTILIAGRGMIKKQIAPQELGVESI
ncbi:MAG: multidrug effflux MFS transporter [Ginsengibacter sp.]